MKKIATHNSGTGEKGTFWSLFVAIFSKTQSKSLDRQFKLGCRYFDFRLKYNKRKKVWKLAHGLWKTKESAWDLIKKVNALANSDRENQTYAYLTYEGVIKNEAREKLFIDMCDKLNDSMKGIKFTSVDAKYSGTQKNPFVVDYKHIKTYNRCPIPGKQGFIPLDGKHWQTYFPIPWLWNLIFTRKHEFTEDKFLFVDFL